MILTLPHTEVYACKCACGWWFPALTPWQKHCPQCRIRVQFCIECGCEIHGLSTKRYCDNCKDTIKKLNDREAIIEKRKNVNYKETGSVVCTHWDCETCPYPDCILPEDEDIQTELFEDKK